MDLSSGVSRPFYISYYFRQHPKFGKLFRKQGAFERGRFVEGVEMIARPEGRCEGAKHTKSPEMVNARNRAVMDGVRTSEVPPVAARLALGDFAAALAERVAKNRTRRALTRHA